MRTLTPSAFVLETLGGFLSGHNVERSNLIAHVMQKIFTTPATNHSAELVGVGIRPLTMDFSLDHTGHALAELQRGEVDLVNGQQVEFIIGDLFQMFILPLAYPGVTAPQIRLNSTVCDALIQHLVYFGYWYRMDHYTNELH